MGTRILREGAEKVYAAAQQWVEQALQRDGSLFTPGEKIWSSEWLGEIHKRFLNNPDESNATFLDKLKGQLRGCPAQVYQLMGEVLYFYFLIVRTKNSTNEQKVIDTVLGWSPSPIEIPQELVNSLTPGIANPGTFFHMGRPFQVGFLIELAEQWKAKTTDDQHRLVNNPWAFKEFAAGINFRSALLKSYPNSARIQLYALLHLVFPDTFESIVSVDDKEKIAKAFEKFVTTPNEDVDRRLAQVRTVLEAEYASTDLFFYTPHVRVQWDDDYKPDLWEDFVRRARNYVDSGIMENEEIEYKLEIGRKLMAAREAVLGGADDWDILVKRGIAGNLINGIEQAKFRDWIDGSPDDASIALRTLWANDSSSVAERIRDFCGLLPRSASSGSGVRTTVASVLMMGLDAEEYPPFRVTVFDQAYQRTGYGGPEQPSDEATLYQHALDFLDHFIDEASKRGLTLRHRLDAQSLVWQIRSESQVKPEQLPPPDDQDPEPPVPATDPWSPSNITTLSRELLWQPTYHLQEVIEDLQEKRQIIFYGPPGTGKTYVAREIAKQCKLNGGDFEIVQFHPSYSYEDFVQGFRPKLMNGQPGFVLIDGPLRRIADKARTNPDATFILIIDELNRGNVAKVFGELYFLLEYRDEEVRLQYGGEGEGFSLPSNLWFICTMNTADRSIALMDAALRRRFYFAPFFPNEPPIEGLLRRWLERHGQDTWVADLVDAANTELDRDAGIGPSYFMGTAGHALDETRVSRIWRRAVEPYLEEQLFGDEDRLQKLKFNELQQRLGNKASNGHDTAVETDAPLTDDADSNTC